MAASSWSGFSEEDQAKIKRELTDKSKTHLAIVHAFIHT